MPERPIEHPVAERSFTVAGDPGRTVTVTLGQPRQNPTGEWACPLDIHGIPDSGRRWIHGVDAFQALQLSLEAVRKVLDESGMSLVWAAQEPGETGFPRYVPYFFGRAFAARIEQHIDAEVEKFAEIARARAGEGSAD